MDEVIEKAEAEVAVKMIREFAKEVMATRFESKFGRGYQAAWERALAMLPEEA